MMSKRKYEDPALDGTMEHLAERDLDEKAEGVEVPCDDTHEGDISTGTASSTMIGYIHRQ